MSREEPVLLWLLSWPHTCYKQTPLYCLSIAVLTVNIYCSEFIRYQKLWESFLCISSLTSLSLWRQYNYMPLYQEGNWDRDANYLDQGYRTGQRWRQDYLNLGSPTGLSCVCFVVVEVGSLLLCSKLTQNSPFNTYWPLTHGNSSALTLLVLGLQMQATTPTLDHYTIIHGSCGIFWYFLCLMDSVYICYSAARLGLMRLLYLTDLSKPFYSGR